MRRTSLSSTVFWRRKHISENWASALKNDLNQIPLLEPFFDFSVNEQCHEFAECNAMAPFVAAGKPVFMPSIRRAL